MSENEKRLTIRIPTSLHEKLTRRAENNRRSLNNEMITLLERFVDSKEVGYKNGFLYQRDEELQVADNPQKGGTGYETQTG